jgi:catalase
MSLHLEVHAAASKAFKPSTHVLQTPIATRFSLVTHPKGSPESLRDTRGMAVGSLY